MYYSLNLSLLQNKKFAPLAEEEERERNEKCGPCLLVVSLHVLSMHNSFLKYTKNNKKRLIAWFIFFLSPKARVKTMHILCLWSVFICDSFRQVSCKCLVSVFCPCAIFEVEEEEEWKRNRRKDIRNLEKYVMIPFLICILFL